MADHCQTETEFLTIFQARLEHAENVDIIADDSEFVRHLVITIIHCVARGARIRIAYYPATFEDSEPRILQLLRGLGCAVYVPPSGSPPPLVGVFFDPKSRADAALLVRVKRLEQVAVHAKLYSSPIDWAVISNAHNQCAPCLPDDLEKPYRPTLEVANIDDIINRLKIRPMYQDADFSYESVNPAEILPQKQLIRRFKHNQIKLLRRIYKTRNWAFYEAAQVLLRGGGFSFITPPVVEEHHDRLIIAEGHTRLFESKSQGDPSIKVLVARSVTAPLPSEAGTWDEVTPTDADVDSQTPPDRIQFTRRIESAAHPTRDWLPRTTLG